MTTGRWWILPVLTGLLAVGGAGEAQERPRPDRARMEEQIRERFEALVFRELELDEETGQALAAAMSSFRPARADLGRRRRALQRRIEEADSLLAEAEAREILDELADVAREESALMIREQEALLEVLTPAQVVRLHGVREEFGARLRQFRDRRRGPGGPGSVVPSGGGLPPAPYWP